jgi:uncharacterized protein YggE
MGQRKIRLHRPIGLRSAGLSALLLAVSCPTAWSHEAAAAPRSLTVSGHGEASAVPDAVHLTFAVESTATTATAAASDNATRAHRLLDAIKPLLTPSERLTTLGYRLQPLYESPQPGHSRSGEHSLVGYRAHNEIAVELHDLTRLGAVIDAAIAAGADRVADVRFDLRDRGATVRGALADAGRDAREQAAAIATALGLTLGGIRSVSTTPDVVHFPRQEFAMARLAAAETPMVPGDLTVSASVQIVYDIAE